VIEIDPPVLAAADEDARHYFEVHRTRYAWLMGRLREATRDWGGAGRLRILDVGQSFLTRLIRQAYPDAVVNTLNSYDDLRYRDRDEHFVWDLNEAACRARWPEIGRYHVIVLAEVIEHLYTAPHLVLGFFAAALAPGGCLIVQTPNAVSLVKRLRLLGGRNPFETIREDRSGHFREYTVAELTAAAQAAGLQVADVSVRNYFRPRRRGARALVHIAGLLPPAFREGITMRLQKA
jgi:trans-aconitate methyltransferase